MRTFIYNRPWIWIVLLFVILIASWVVLFKIAAEHGPVPIEPDSPPQHERP